MQAEAIHRARLIWLIRVGGAATEESTAAAAAEQTPGKIFIGMPLLSKGSNIKDLQPQRLAEEIQQQLQNAEWLYEKE